eukprot:CAMPEP_0196657134 /NCGR_PEP_ID=MMETSP1086-20130531/22029_1 /TAXON_ID=77921 /ORGANISM="Cyanoptyche  gloeocystis , Strain SAG4.97" /LENGTH=100 /DNA_ID=CAMNT_0041990159 /DNA_START=23 /DNA_END=321 /DNA_ORIENTATION=-
MRRSVFLTTHKDALTPTLTLTLRCDAERPSDVTVGNRKCWRGPVTIVAVVYTVHGTTLFLRKKQKTTGKQGVAGGGWMWVTLEEADEGIFPSETGGGEAG